MEQEHEIKNLRNFLQFTLDLSCADVFENQVMILLKNIINFDSGLFISMGKTGVPNTVIGYNIAETLIKNYKESVYTQDPINSYPYKTNPSTKTERVMILSANDGNDQHSKFINYMKKADLYYCIFLTINDRGDGFRLFRKESSNSSSDEDVEICNYLSSILGKVYETSIRNKSTYSEAQLFKITKATMLFGYAIFDQDFSVIFSNKKANERILKITQKFSYNDMMSDFTHTIKNIIADNANKKSDTIFYDITQNYILEIIKYLDVDELDCIHMYHIVYIYDKKWFSSMLKLNAEKVIDQYDLTDREKELVKLIYKGLSNNKISDDLFISTFTVKEHLKNIYRKLELNTRGELMAKIFDDCK